jgi:hypothetical protein
MRALATRHIFIFADFRLDCRRGGLFRRGEDGAEILVALGSRALDILSLLIDRHGDLVTKDEITAIVWRGAVVEDSNLACTSPRSAAPSTRAARKAAASRPSSAAATASSRRWCGSMPKGLRPLRLPVAPPRFRSVTPNALRRRHLVQSRTNDAIVWLERARRANPQFPGVHAMLAAAYALNGEINRAAPELAEARRLSRDGRYSSMSRLKEVGYFGVPEVRAMVEATYFAGLRKAGMPEE